MADTTSQQLESALETICELVPEPPQLAAARKDEYWAAERQPNDVVVKVAQTAYPMPPQTRGWSIPAAVREYAIAVLWRILRAPKASHANKIRAVEALVKLDTHTLATERQDDWREVQSARSSRSNVRVLAELARNAE